MRACSKCQKYLYLCTTLYTFSLYKYIHEGFGPDSHLLYVTALRTSVANKGKDRMSFPNFTHKEMTATL